MQAGLHRRLYGIGRLLWECEPSLMTHMERLDVRPALFAAPWFLSIFAAAGFPIGFVVRVLDLLFVEGIHAIFKLILILLGSCSYFPLLLTFCPILIYMSLIGLSLKTSNLKGAY